MSHRALRLVSAAAIPVAKRAWSSTPATSRTSRPRVTGTAATTREAQMPRRTHAPGVTRDRVRVDPSAFKTLEQEMHQLAERRRQQRHPSKEHEHR